jgi:glycerophosphoryl diester phosphodiesterase
MTDIFAHRGSCALSRENTVAAFEAARGLGADGVELDVHRTSDGEIVVHHDATVPGLGAIARLGRSELPDWLPTLEEALDASSPLLVNVELKVSRRESGDAAGALLAADVAGLLASRGDAAQMVVSSFSLEAVDVVHSLQPGLASALLVDSREDPMRSLKIARDHGHTAIHPYFESVGEALVDAARGAGMAVRPWTVDDPARIAALGALGVDAVITNDVTAARHALGR